MLDSEKGRKSKPVKKKNNRNQRKLETIGQLPSVDTKYRCQSERIDDNERMNIKGALGLCSKTVCFGS